MCSRKAVDPHQLLMGKGWGVLDCRNGWQWLRGHFAGFGMSGKSKKQQLNANFNQAETAVNLLKCACF